MGIDAYIALKATGPIDLQWSLPREYEIRPASDYLRSRLDVTHEIESYSRYYSPDYERGNWPELCACLMLLYACPNIERVYYGGDGGAGIQEFTIDDVLEFSRRYMEHGSVTAGRKR